MNVFILESSYEGNYLESYSKTAIKKRLLLLSILIVIVIIIIIHCCFTKNKGLSLEGPQEWTAGVHLLGLFNHSDVFPTDGQVYTWGQDSRGQLGLGKKKSGTSSPQQLRCLSSIPLVQVSAGGEQSFALSVSGGVFGWGRNDHGQLGLGDTEGNVTISCVPTVCRGADGLLSS